MAFNFYTLSKRRFKFCLRGNSCWLRNWLCNSHLRNSLFFPLPWKIYCTQMRTHSRPGSPGGEPSAPKRRLPAPTSTRSPPLPARPFCSRIHLRGSLPGTVSRTFSRLGSSCPAQLLAPQPRPQFHSLRLNVHPGDRGIHATSSLRLSSVGTAVSRAPQGPAAARGCHPKRLAGPGRSAPCAPRGSRRQSLLAFPGTCPPEVPRGPAGEASSKLGPRLVAKRDRGRWPLSASSGNVWPTILLTKFSPGLSLN